jgi:HK97 family phage prohead protease
VVVRSTEDSGKKYIEGLIPYNSKSLPLWGDVIEVIERGAFNRAVSGKETVLALWNHDDSRVLGSTVSGTLVLEDSEAGLVCRCAIPNTTYANDLYEIVSRGDIRTMSFGFIPEDWDYNQKEKTRTLKDARLDEVSFGVSFPAYPETKSEVSIRGGGLVKRAIDVESINALLDKEELTDDDKAQIEELIRVLQELIGGEQGESESQNEPPPEEEARAAKEKEALALLTVAVELETELGGK